MQRIILHIDFDSFFASVEQQDNSLYRNRPLGVTATNGRTCIIAASREAKQAGITSPSRTQDARRICPGIIFVPAHFVRYWEVSKQFIKLCDNFSPVVEVFSLDEVFMDVTYTAPLFGGVYPLIEKFKLRLAEELGDYITASVGVSPNKLLSKLASGLKKPNGVMEITHENMEKVYAEAKLTDICGIGYGIKKRLNQMGIYTPLQLRFVPLSSLIAEFGEVEGKFLNDVGFGHDTRPLIPYTEKPKIKSVSRNYCLPANEYDHRKVLQNVYELCEEVGLKLRRLGKKARTVGLYLGGSESVHGRQTYTNYLDTGKELFEACSSFFSVPEYVRQISIWVSNLEDEEYVPSSLFTYDQKQQKIIKAIDKINEKFGDHTVRNGFLLYADKLTTVPNGYGTDTYERSKLALR